MKILLSVIFIALLAVTENTCRNKKKLHSSVNCYRGRLEVKAGCMNYTIAITEGPVDTSLVLSSWTDENTGKSYKNAFALGSKCDFPDTINEGDSFYFAIDSSTAQNCAVCMMYYPVPSKKLNIRVINDPCPKP